MKIEISFKHEDEALLAHYFRTKTHPIIRAVLWDLAFFVWTNWYITLTVTGLWRSTSYNQWVGGSPTSRHLELPCKAADLRILDWPKEVKPQVIDYLTRSWGDLIWINDEKNHLHLQLTRRHFTDGDLTKT